MLRIAVGEAVHTVSEAEVSASDFEITIDGQIHQGWRYATADEVYIRLHGRTYVVGLPQSSAALAAAGQADNEIRADMPGTVVAIHCAEGEEVASGQKLITIESMKLQIGLVAPRDGTVAKVHVGANATFERGATLVSLAPANKE